MIRSTFTVYLACVFILPQHFISVALLWIPLDCSLYHPIEEIKITSIRLKHPTPDIRYINLSEQRKQPNRLHKTKGNRMRNYYWLWIANGHTKHKRLLQFLFIRCNISQSSTCFVLFFVSKSFDIFNWCMIWMRLKENWERFRCNVAPSIAITIPSG